MEKKIDTNIVDCNNIIEQQLANRAKALEDETGADVLFFCGPIV